MYKIKNIRDVRLSSVRDRDRDRARDRTDLPCSPMTGAQNFV
jgi:hypothetical protein